MSGSVTRWPRMGSVCLVALVSLAGIGCPWDRDCEDTEPNLVLEDNSLAAWIAINNTFIDTRPAGQEGFWTGLLFQIGDFEGPPEVNQVPRETRWAFDRVTFHLEESEIGKPLEWGDPLFWINIVSDYEGHLDPMEPQDALKLFPNPTHAIHSGMTVPHGMITYWQGQSGYRIAANQDAPHLGNKYRFWFEDGFRVEVYQVVDSDPTLVQTFAKGEIDQIRIVRKAGPPSDGDKQDPPWPDPPPNP